jgi:hypothetical protein
MTPKTTQRKIWTSMKLPAAAALALAFCAFTLPASAQQNQPNQDQAAPPSQETQPQAQPDAQAQGQQTAPNEQQPEAQPQGQMDQGQTDQGQPDQPQPPSQDQQQPAIQPHSQPEQKSEPQANQPAPPATLTLPAGTVIRVRVEDWISSDRNVIGDNFGAELEQPIVVNGWVVARRGQAQTGRVSQVKKGHTSQLGLELPQLTLVDGQQIALQAQLFQASGGGNRNTDRDVATVGGTTGLGAIIGGIAGGGTGAAIGAGLGATAGIIGVMSTEGRPTVIRPETVLSFRLTAPVTVSTTNSRFAFQPVKQSDYDSRSPQNRPRLNRPGPPPPPPYYPYPYAYGYPYPYAYPYYPAPFVGFGYYGRYGWH